MLIYVESEERNAAKMPVFAQVVRADSLEAAATLCRTAYPAGILMAFEVRDHGTDGVLPWGDSRYFHR